MASAGLVCLAALIVLGAYTRVINVTRVHYISGLVDQVWHVSAARELAETGRLTSNVIFTSLIYQDFTKNILYMPGYYFVLAAVYKLLGFGWIQSMLPSLISFVLAAVCIYLLARRLYGGRAALGAVVLFLFFPAVLFYAFTAMLELVFIAVCLLTMCLFVFLRHYLRPWLGGILLLLPFLIRETGVVLVIPMALLVAAHAPEWRERLGSLAIFVLATGLLLISVARSELLAGRPSMLFAFVMAPNDTVLYFDPAAQSAVIHPTLAEGISAVIRKSAANLSWLLFDPHKSPFEDVFFFCILGAVILCMLIGFRNRDMFALGSGLASLCMFAFIVGFNRLSGYIGMRHLLFTTPLLMVVVGAVFAQRLSAWSRTSSKTFVQLGAALVLLGYALISVLSVRFMYKDAAGFDAFVDGFTRLVETLGHDDNTVLVSAFPYSAGYAFTHHPVRWALLPANEESLQMLASKYAIGTLILPRARRLDAFPLTDASLHSVGLTYERTVSYGGIEYGIYKHKIP